MLEVGKNPGNVIDNVLFPYAELMLKNELKILNDWTPTLSLLEKGNPGWNLYTNLFPEPVGW